jgi:hypothetical protein
VKNFFGEKVKYEPPPKGKAEVDAVQKGTRSPLALSRPHALITKPQSPTETFETWEENQKAIIEAFNAGAQITLIRADTGVGKDYVKLSYIFDSPRGTFVESVPTTDLCIEKEQDFETRTRTEDNPYHTIYRWRGIMSGWKANDERPIHERIAEPFPEDSESLCIQAPLFRMLRSKGATPHAVLCPKCPVQSQCNFAGYRSQTGKAKDVSYVITPHRDLFFHPVLHEFSSKLLKGKREPIGIVDELKAHELFIECEISKRELQRLKQMWEGEPLSDFAHQLLIALVVDTTPNIVAVKEIIEEMSESDRQACIQAFTHIRCPEKWLLYKPLTNPPTACWRNTDSTSPVVITPG